MATQAVKFTPAAAARIAAVVKAAEAAPTDRRGRRRQSGTGPSTDYGSGSKYQVLMTLDDAGTVGWDWCRLH